MILCHNGVVQRHLPRWPQGERACGWPANQEQLAKVLAEQRDRPGIVDIQVEIAADRDLKVGDDVMMLVVAGDIRENVIAALTDTLNAIKHTVTTKTEFFS